MTHDPSEESGPRRDPALRLSERQQTTVAAAVTVLATVVIFCALGALLWLLSLFLRAFSNVFLPLAVAAVVSLVLEPYYKWWSRRLDGGRLERWRLSKVLALVLVFLSILVPVVGVGTVFGGLLAGQIGDLVDQAPTWWENARQWFEERLPRMVELWERYGLQERMESALSGQEGSLLSALRALGLKGLAAGADFFGVLVGLLNWFLVPIYVAFILFGDLGSRRHAWWRAALPFLKESTRGDIAYLVSEFVAIVVAFFRGQLLIAFLQGVLFAVGFTIVGLSYGWLLGLTLGFLNVIPYLGSIVGLGVAIPIALFQEDGGWLKVAAVLIVFTVVQMIEGYVLTPKIMGDQTGLHPMAIMVAIFFWGTALNGIMGMLLAIPLTAFFVVFWRLVREKYIEELV
jgi:predicted PurR-regulated permease PerM